MLRRMPLARRQIDVVADRLAERRRVEAGLGDAPAARRCSSRRPRGQAEQQQHCAPASAGVSRFFMRPSLVVDVLRCRTRSAKATSGAPHRASRRPRTRRPRACLLPRPRPARSWRAPGRARRRSGGLRARKRARDLMLGMSGTRFGLEDVAGYDPLQLSGYENAVASSNGGSRPIATSPGSSVRRRACCGASGCATTSPTPLVPPDMPSSCVRRGYRRSRRQGVADRPDQPPRTHGCGAHPRARPRSRRRSRRRQARPAGSCSPIRPTRAGR